MFKNLAQLLGLGLLIIALGVLVGVALAAFPAVAGGGALYVGGVAGGVAALAGACLDDVIVRYFEQHD